MRERKGIRLLALILALVMLPVIPVAAEEDVVIVLDPGHGGIDSGAVMEYDGEGIWESTLNLEIAGYCRDYLEENYENVQVYLTRETDEKVTLDERVDFAETMGADYMLSIHINSVDGRSRGALAIVPRGRYQPEQGAASKRTAEAILLRLEALGMRNRGTTYQLGDDLYPDGTNVDSFAVIRGCVRRNIPCIIMEHGFLDNEKDYREFLSTPEQLRALGEADALGLAETLGLEFKGPPSSAELGDTPFEDVLEGGWFYDAVTYVWNEGLMNGLSDTEFGPAMTANRAMVVTLLYRLDGAEASPEDSSFTDVEPGSWYHAPVEWALENGITTGISETEFAPGRNVIREQFVTFLYRYAGASEPETMPEHFADWDSVSGYARAAVAWAVEIGLMTGYEDGTVKPLRELNRAELAVLMHRFHLWLLHDRGELTYEWTQSVTEAQLYVGESFELTLTNQYGDQADAVWSADCEGVVQIEGTTVTAVGEGAALLSCEHDGQLFDCYVEVTEEVITWSISHTEAAIHVGESFELTLTNQHGEQADVIWSADCEGVVQIEGATVTAVGEGTAVLSCEYDGQLFECHVEVTEKVVTWKISHTDVTIKVGESFNLRVKSSEGETASVVWSSDKSGYVTISGNKITGQKAGTVNVSCVFEGVTYKCIVRVKSA